MPIIQAQNLVKEFKQQKQKAGLAGTVKSLFKKESEIKRAVDGITFSVEPGELIGYIGPNGAGKSTTIKMLTGILVPTSGQVYVNGLIPHENRKANASKIGAVFGQRSQLWWDLPIGETYNLLRHMYRIDSTYYENRLKFLKDLLELNEFWERPVRQLSLGQRMRGELGAALLHNPPILFLDEPTIGMDAIVKERIRQFLVDINRHDGTTIILTTHDLEEVERTCSRVLVINYGKLLFNGSVDNLRNQCNADSILTVDFYDPPPLEDFNNVPVVEYKDNRISFSFNRRELNISKFIGKLIGSYSVKDISIKEPPIDTVIKDLYEAPDIEKVGDLSR